MTSSSFRRTIVMTTIAVVIATLTLPACAPVLVAGAATGALLSKDRRTAGTIIDDQAIELKIANRLATEKSFEKVVHVNATSFNKTVLLTGEVPSEAVRDQIIEIASGTEGVKQVYNSIDLSVPTEFNSRNFDASLTIKVKASLFDSKDLDAAYVKVVSENAVVYLMGLVSHDEADKAARVASGVDGVKRVVKVFEYTD